ncbi:MAG: DNA mismatch repair protein MutS [Verrucomicrobiota bacterium JB022]|nr:DNA mismatch repair protein MutS [Verrucomicrobiota bacterium JB022]
MSAKKSDGRKLTPMMQQYMEVRRQLPTNTLLLFRLGDFYEMFEEDAEEGARLLGITLTNRNGQKMAGIPFHAADTYVQKVLNQGVKVAIVDQMETPRPGQLVKRELTRILTPGTAIEDHQMDARSGHYLLAIEIYKGEIYASWLDLSTGEFQVAHEEKPDNLLSVLSSLRPRELIIADGAWQRWGQQPDLDPFLEHLQRLRDGTSCSEVPEYYFDRMEGARLVMETLGVLNLDGFGLETSHPGLGAAGALLIYANENLRAAPENLNRIRAYRSTTTLLLDPSTQRNLEIFRSSTNTRQGSLLAAMDRTVTAPGARLLEQFLTEPTLDLAEIRRRSQCVAEFLEAPQFAAELQEYLKGVRDLPRILGRLRNRLRNPRELGAIRDTLRQLPMIRAVLDSYDGIVLQGLANRIDDYEQLCGVLDAGLAEELPNDLRDGNYIANEYDEDLDHYRSLARDSQQWLIDLEQQERERTGIKNLRIKQNSAFGYFIEITKSNLQHVPDDYRRKQTVANAERYVTDDLKEKEQEIAHADEKALEREQELFRELVTVVLDHAEELETTAQALAELDVYAGWAKLARECDYCQPKLDESTELVIDGGRHPVVEQMMRAARVKGLPGQHDFVPNDTLLNSGDEQIAIITGPNMAGKSTYIRQVALIVLMAQVGCWVPAQKCRIGLVDRIFSRVGASDELARGNSTFMVEMNETANILNHATERSLIILDEIGRGTSTYDGLSIAWAVVEHLHGARALEDSNIELLGDFGSAGPRTLFATHYHELTQIDRQLTRVRNYSVAVKEWNDQIIFVRQVQRGAADRSYGIQVARLAGLPVSVIDRAKRILAKLESEDTSHNVLRQRFKKIKEGEKTGEEPQLELF